MSVFLTISEDRVIYRGDFFFMIYDAYPVSTNHLLIISNELREDYFSLTEEEQQELPKMINKAKSLFPDQNFKRQDIFEKPLEQEFDYILLSGVFTDSYKSPSKCNIEISSTSKFSVVLSKKPFT